MFLGSRTLNEYDDDDDDRIQVCLKRGERFLPPDSVLIRRGGSGADPGILPYQYKTQGSGDENPQWDPAEGFFRINILKNHFVMQNFVIWQIIKCLNLV